MSENACSLCLGLMLSLHAGSVLGQDTSTSSPFRVVGYLPDYRVEMIDPSVGRQLTDVVFFSVLPEPRGQFQSKVLQSPRTVKLLTQLRNEFHVKIHLCIGGWDRSNGFAEIASTPVSRKAFATGLTTYCRQHGFDGADLDWEHPKDAEELTNYGLLLSEIADDFKPHGLQLTAAMAAWQTLTPAGIKAVDAIHLMSYDAEGKHSTLGQAQADVRKFRDAGVPAGKLRLGLPFYGRGITDRNVAKAYSELAPAVKTPETDELDGIYFNGPDTIRAKTRFAQEQKLSGVMIWEIAQDAAGDASLLKSIRSEIFRRDP